MSFDSCQIFCASDYLGVYIVVGCCKVIIAIAFCVKITSWCAVNQSLLVAIVIVVSSSSDCPRRSVRANSVRTVTFNLNKILVRREGGLTISHMTDIRLSVADVFTCTEESKQLDKHSEHTSSPPGEALAHVVGATNASATTRVRASCLCSNKKGKHDVKPHRVLTLTMTSSTETK